MRYRTLGGTNMDVSIVCCGALAMGGNRTFGPPDDEVSVRAVRAALDEGINFFDTAEVYGGGHSEEILGRALESVREEVIIATKVSGRHLPEPDIFEACESSLRRLRTGYIDVYQVHWPNHDIPFSETAALLERLKEQGKIREWGVSNFGTVDLGAALEAGQPAVDQLPYSLAWRAIEFEILPVCLENEVSVICYSPMAQGILTGKFASVDDVPAQRRRPRYCGEAAVHLTFELVGELRAVSKGMGEPMADVALGWVLAQPGVACVIAGMRTPEQARQNARAAELTLLPDALERLDRISEPLKNAIGTNPDMWQSGEKSRYR